MALLSVNGEQQNVRMIFNDWIDVQEDRYGYLATDEVDGLVIRIVIAEYLACEIAWIDNTIRGRLMQFS
jgi:hypothetical protein